MTAPAAGVERARTLGPRVRAILALALPIVGGMMSQNLLNIVDTAMVGTLGAPALAAVGLGSFASWIVLTLVTGLASGGVQPMAARRYGEGRVAEAAVPLNGGLLLGLVIGVPLAALVVPLVPALFPRLNSDPVVVAQGVPYMQARLVAAAPLAMNFAFRGFWNAINMSRVYFRTLILIHVLNVVFNWVLIFGHLGAPALGTLGAGIASAVATTVGTGYYFAIGLRLARPAGFLHAFPGRDTLRAMLRLGVPVGLQQFFFFGGFTVLFWIVGRVGTTELAAAHVLVTLTLAAILPGIGLGLAAATLVGQALGRGDPADAARWGWDVVRVAVVSAAAVALPMLVVPDVLLGGFLHAPAALAVARVPLRIVGTTLLADMVGLVLFNALIGAGAARRVFALSVSLQWGLALPAAWVVGPRLGYGLTGIWAVHGAWRVLQGAAFAIMWRRGAWKTSRV